jgi:S-adenosylmethionine:tRNA ribosyltransferase-isomerase
VRTELFDYDLPEERIARHPAERRDGARLLVVRPEALEHRKVTEFAELVPEGALVVVNDTRVRRARVFGARRGSGGRIEIFFLAPIAGDVTRAGSERWAALGRASKPLRAGTLIDAEDLVAEVLDRDEAGILTLEVSAPGGVEAWLEAHGHVPIPPYLGRADEPEDVERYQTVYARRTGSVAAPTAGLHLTAEAFARLEARGVELGRVELEVGLGTFRPVEADDLDQHPMHTERFAVSPELAERVAAARARGGQVVAVGTTVVRALESAADPERPGLVRPYRGETRLLIQPGYGFRVVDSLLTNFHQPRSTLIALVSAFAGLERVRSAYAEALQGSYRFLSYGDAMWIPRRA